MSRKKAIKLPSQMKQDKRKLRVEYLQNSNGGPLFLQNQGDFLGCQQMATCWAKHLSPHVYLKVIDIGKQNQSFLKISNFHTT